MVHRSASKKKPMWPLPRKLEGYVQSLRSPSKVTIWVPQRDSFFDSTSKKSNLIWSIVFHSSCIESYFASLNVHRYSLMTNHLYQWKVILCPAGLMSISNSPWGCFVIRYQADIESQTAVIRSGINRCLCQNKNEISSFKQTNHPSKVILRWWLVSYHEWTLMSEYDSYSNEWEGEKWSNPLSTGVFPRRQEHQAMSPSLNQRRQL